MVYGDTQPTALNIDDSTRSPLIHATDGVAAENYLYMRRIHSRQG